MNLLFGTFLIFSYTPLMLHISQKALFQAHPTGLIWHILILFKMLLICFDNLVSFYRLLRSVLGNFQVFRDFLDIFPLLISTSIL